MKLLAGHNLPARGAVLRGYALGAGVVAITNQLTLVSYDDVTKELTVESTVEGTCYYATVTDGAIVTVPAEVVNGTNPANQTNGTAGFFLSIGPLSDLDIPFDGLLSDTPYELALVVDINDGGTYTNVLMIGFTTDTVAASGIWAFTGTTIDTIPDGARWQFTGTVIDALPGGI